MRRTSDWVISRSWPVNPPSGEGCDSAYIVRLVDADGATSDLIVEFDAPSSLTSVGYAEEIARKVRDRAELPTHVIVNTRGGLRIVGASPEDSEDAENDTSAL